MSQRLVKVAKELNVGTDSIVAYLTKKGFVVKAQPTSMISDEMHNLLLQEFSGSKSIKEQASKVVFKVENDEKKKLDSTHKLIKVAKELNVSTNRIVEFLLKRGITINTKPTTQISDVMYLLLKKEFKSPSEQQLLTINLDEKKNASIDENVKPKHRLVKVAKELNVGSDSIVEFLAKKGYKIQQPSPTSFISDEMFNLVLREFNAYAPLNNPSSNGIMEPSTIETPVKEQLANTEFAQEDVTEAPIDAIDKESGSKENHETLSNEDMALEPQQTIELSLIWINLQFADFKIVVSFEGFRVEIREKRSKSTYNLIKSFFEQRQIIPPALIKSEKGYHLDGIDRFFELIEVGRMIMQMRLLKTEQYLKYHSMLQTRLKNSTLSNDTILKLFRKDKSKYIEYLARKQSSSFTIIPVQEIVFQDNRVARIDNSFIFTIQRSNLYFLFWESVEESKATHVFRFNENNIHFGRQKLQSYVLDRIDYKRDRLRYVNDPFRIELGHIAAINHTDFISWYKRINNVLSKG